MSTNSHVAHAPHRTIRGNREKWNQACRGDFTAKFVECVVIKQVGVLAAAACCVTTLFVPEWCRIWSWDWGVVFVRDRAKMGGEVQVRNVAGVVVDAFDQVSSSLNRRSRYLISICFSKLIAEIVLFRLLRARPKIQLIFHFQ